MKLIVGLGNIGEKYEKTRHNLGFMVVDRFLQDSTLASKTTWEENKKFKALTAEQIWQPKHGKEEKLLLVKPTTHMNGSGIAVSLISLFYKVKPDDIWVVHDELDLPLGSMKIRIGGSSAGHRGIENIIEQLGTEKFWRFRLGIGTSKNHSEAVAQKKQAVDDFVLGKFSASEKGKVRELIKRSSHAIQESLENGLASAGNRYNTK